MDDRMKIPKNPPYTNFDYSSLENIYILGLCVVMHY
jgi:hypothetical protein